MKIFKPNFWNKKKSLIAIALLPVSAFLQVFISLKNQFINKKKFSIPVIGVGNIYVGGTGKTPLSIEIVKILKKLNKKVAIIKKSYEEHNDEFKLIKSKEIKLFKNTLRGKAINEAIKNNFDCVILDDGFQDLSINKSLDILCFNEKQLAGNEMTLPSGPLREPLSSIKRCQIIMINGKTNIEFEKKIKGISDNIKIFYMKYFSINIEDFKGHNLLAFAGIGNPENFFNLLEENNLKIIKKISFPDHYNYSLKELNELILYATKHNLKIVTTEKDFFRINHLQLSQIQCLNVELKILDKNNFQKELLRYL